MLRPRLSTVETRLTEKWGLQSWLLLESEDLWIRWCQRKKKESKLNVVGQLGHRGGCASSRLIQAFGFDAIWRGCATMSDSHVANDKRLAILQHGLC